MLQVVQIMWKVGVELMKIAEHEKTRYKFGRSKGTHYNFRYDFNFRVKGEAYCTQDTRDLTIFKKNKRLLDYWVMTG